MAWYEKDQQAQVDTSNPIHTKQCSVESLQHHPQLVWPSLVTKGETEMGSRLAAQGCGQGQALFTDPIF
jgi:hypothetical protein